jgi:hypothetical protein
MIAALTAEIFRGRLDPEANEAQRVAYRRYFPSDETFIGVRMGTVFALARSSSRCRLPRSRSCSRGGFTRPGPGPARSWDELAPVMPRAGIEKLDPDIRKRYLAMRSAK